MSVLWLKNVIDIADNLKTNKCFLILVFLTSACCGTSQVFCPASKQQSRIPAFCKEIV